jgi:hypothetical protein
MTCVTLALDRRLPEQLRKIGAPEPVVPQRGSAWRDSASGVAVARSGCEGLHRWEFHCVTEFLGRRGSGPPSGAVVAAIDPYRRNAVALRRDMVVEQALRDVQVAIARHVQLIECAAEGFEVVGRRRLPKRARCDAKGARSA